MPRCSGRAHRRLTWHCALILAWVIGTLREACVSSRAGVRAGWAGWEFYVHLNLVRSCETPSDPTRCQLPPWVPSRLRAGSRAASRGLCCASHLASPRGFSLCLAGFSRTLCGFRGSCWTSLSFVQCFAVYHVPCGLSSLVALRGICFFRPLLSLLLWHLAQPCALLLILSHLVRLCWFRAVSFLSGYVLHSVADSLLLVKPCSVSVSFSPASLAALAVPR